MNRRVIRGLFVVLLLGLITHCASKTQVRVRYRVVPQRSPERFQPPKQSPSPRGLLL
ncbi:putative lipoprotein [Synechococcus sp. PROS-9-1]|nr:putative lipoprotein [Synechococcus sp. PROS-9-1]